MQPAGQLSVLLVALLWAAGAAMLATSAAAHALPPRRGASIFPTPALSSLLQPGGEQADHQRRLQAAGAPFPIDMSVVLLYQSDVQGGKSSPCAQMVDRVKALKGRTANFVVTAYYVDYNKDMIMDELGYRASPWDKSFRGYDWTAARAFSEGLSACMRHAVDAGLQLAVHIHLDDAASTTWRNALKFDPTTKYGQLSYYDALVKPVAEAVKLANYKGQEVLFAMQAEMGATLFYYPRQYHGMISSIKNIVATGGTRKDRVLVGVNTNWEKLCGCPSNLIYSTDYYAKLKSDWENVKKVVSVSEVQKLFRAVDWIGVSAYAALPERVTAADLEASFRKVDQELGLFGLSLASLGKPLVMSEFGVGGGMKDDYSTPAPNAAVAAAAPYWGVDGVYSRARDPWLNASNRKFLHRFYKAAASFAAAGGGAKYKVKAIFVWNIISYDAQGIHYYSSSIEGSYRDKTVVNMLSQHNAKYRG